MKETKKDTPEEKKRKAGLRKEVREKTAGYIVTALGLVAGLAWNDAISSLIKSFFPPEQGDLIAKFIYAIIITIVIVVASSWFMRFFGPKE